MQYKREQMTDTKAQNVHKLLNFVTTFGITVESALSHGIGIAPLCQMFYPFGSIGIYLLTAVKWVGYVVQT